VPRYLPVRLLLWGVVLALPATLVYRCVGAGSGFDTPSRASGASLKEEPFTVLFDPGQGPGQRLRLDWADVRTVAHTEFFRRNGHSNIPDDSKLGTERLGRDGFPHLELTWPSLHMPPQPLCTDAAGGLQERCPVVVTTLTSEPPAQLRTRLSEGEVWQWTAFLTRHHGEGEQWAGWQCDPQRQGKGNTEIKAPDAERRQWAVHPLLMQRDCNTPRGLLEKRAPAALSGLRENVVLWSCTQAGEDNKRPDVGECQASFVHRGRMVRLRIPGSAWIGDAEHQMSALQQLRPRLLEAAWRTLEDAAAAAREGAPPADWQGALRRDLAWCDEYAQRTADLKRRTGEVVARQAWDRPHMRIASYDQRGPCARAFHRVLRALENVPEDGKPPALLVASARRLADIEAASERSLSRPLWALASELIARDAGARSMALLQWRVQHHHKNLEQEELLAHYDALREQVAQLPARERLALRLSMATGNVSGGPLGERATEFEWELARDWAQSPGVLELPPEQVLAMLLSPAAHARKLPPDDANARLQVLVPAMQRQAMQIAQDTNMLAQHKLLHVATLSLHAAWHANRLAVQASDPAQWKSWLVDHATWVEGALPTAPRDWVAGVTAHRDAALRNKTTDHDCPGAALLQCRWTYQPPALTGIIR
jgi:hypothetical protein